MTVSNSAKGVAYTRLAMALAVAKGELLDASAYAHGRWGEGSPAACILKAAVAVGSLTPGSDWGPVLADFEASQAKFFALVRERSAIGRLSGLRRVPCQTRMVNQVGATTAGWVSEGKPIPLTRLPLAEDSMNPLKLAAIAVISAELARSSNPDAEATIRQDLIEAAAAAQDLAFLDPTNAGEADTRPAAVTFGAEVTTGSTADPDDVKNLIAEFEGDLTRAFIIASPKILVGLSGAALPNVGARGGEIFGVPAIPSAGTGDAIALIDPNGIGFGEAGGTLEASGQASVEMVDNPGLPTQTTVVTSLWQVNAVAIRMVKYTNWGRVQPGSVRIMEAA